ncbi:MULTISPECIES: ABC transporter permease [Metabacillus]|uniref:ABC transporter permease n=1 Tax=Metabacillus hrfriensis TaxID=3048891 RepID=A0ACD4R914_9BACI|nr:MULTISPECIES: ABC transporter permease [Metabacillus]UAL51469.1 ABC transporter permease [Metabacillus dongyingensis]WHZ56976.1 ABC transporter permease [Metabacillus sp. CT-WN-B3]
MKNLRNTVKTLSGIALPGIVLLSFLFLWELAVIVSKVENWILPRPTHIFITLAEMRGTIGGHILQTLSEAVLGLLIAVTAGVLIAILIDLSDWVRKAVEPLLVLSQTIPIIALAPLLIIWFGFGIFPKVIVVALVCFFPIAINLSDGFRLVDRDMVKLMRTLGASRRQMFLKLKLPAATPFFFSGLKIAGTYSVMGAVIGEWLGASKGLGILLTRSSQSFLTDKVFATIVLIVGLSLIIFTLIEILARIMMPWKYKQQKHSN